MLTALSILCETIVIFTGMSLSYPLVYLLNILMKGPVDVTWHAIVPQEGLMGNGIYQIREGLLAALGTNWETVVFLWLLMYLPAAITFRSHVKNRRSLESSLALSDRKFVLQYFGLSVLIFMIGYLISVFFFAGPPMGGVLPPGGWISCLFIVSAFGRNEKGGKLSALENRRQSIPGRNQLSVYAFHSGRNRHPGQF